MSRDSEAPRCADSMCTLKDGHSGAHSWRWFIGRGPDGNPDSDPSNGYESDAWGGDPADDHD